MNFSTITNEMMLNKMIIFLSKWHCPCNLFK